MFTWWMLFAQEYARVSAERRQQHMPSAKAKGEIPPTAVEEPVASRREPQRDAVMKESAITASGMTLLPTEDAQRDRERRLEEALTRSESALRLAEDGRSAFLSAMSHELRTPLNAIMGFAEMMLNGVQGPLGNPIYHEYTQHIHDSGGELLSKVNDLLAIGSMHANEFMLDESCFPLSELLAEAIAVHSHAAFARGMKLRLDAPKGVELQGDRRQLLCVLAHFLSNAIHHSEDDKEILITARLQAEDGLIISVRDQGEGIAPAQLTTIRESLQKEASYFTIQGGGIGLGLALARELAARHGGRVVIDSIRHKGTVTSLMIPPQRITKGLNVKKKQTSRPPHPGRILEIL